MAERLLALTALAGRMVVVAAATDEWETARRGFARLLGRGDAEQTRLTEQRLEQTREQLTRATAPSAGQIRTMLAAQWAGRLADLLEENPDAEAELKALVREIEAVPHATMRLASSHAASADGAATTNAAAEPPPEHPDTLTNRHNLANFTGYAGDAAAARDQFAALLPARERVSGRDHPDTLAARFNLAYWTGRAGDAAAARDQLAALLPARERVSGRDHPDTLATREELAYWTGCAADAAAQDLPAAPPLARQRVPDPAESARPAITSEATRRFAEERGRGVRRPAVATVVLSAWVVAVWAASVALLAWTGSHQSRAAPRPTVSTAASSPAAVATTIATSPATTPISASPSPSFSPSPTFSRPAVIVPPPAAPSPSPSRSPSPSTSPSPSASKSPSSSPSPSGSPSPSPSASPSPSSSKTSV